MKNTVAKSKHTGKTYNHWTLLEVDPKNRRKHLCICQCGKKETVYTSNITSGKSTNCRECQALKKSLHLKGKKIFFLKILDVVKINGKSKLLVECDCGNITYLNNNLGNKPGKYISCGKCNLGIKTKKCKYEYKYMTLGKKFGDLEIVENIDAQTAIAKCICGQKLEVKRHHLQTLHPSCGCFWKNQRIKNAKRLEGYIHGYLKIKKFIGMKGTKKTRAHYLLECKCGKEFERSISYLWGSKSCGCLQKEKAPKGEDNGGSKSKNCEILSIRELQKTGIYTQKELADMFQTNESRISNIILKKTWKHLP